MSTQVAASRKKLVIWQKKSQLNINVMESRGEGGLALLLPQQQSCNM